MTPKGGNTKQTLQDRSHDVWLCACSHGRVQRCALLVASTTPIECNLLGHHGSHDSNLHSICVPLMFTFFQGPPLRTHPFNRSKKTAAASPKRHILKLPWSFPTCNDLTDGSQHCWFVEIWIVCAQHHRCISCLNRTSRVCTTGRDYSSRNVTKCVLYTILM